MAFRAQRGRTTKVWVQLHDGSQQLFRRLRAGRVFQMLESDDPDADYRELVAWHEPDTELVDLPKRGMPCGAGMRERIYQGHFKDRQPAAPSPTACPLDF